MGFGAALGVGVEAWQREDTRQTVKAQNERQADRLDRGMELQEEQNIRSSELHKANLGIKREQLKAFNDPEARKLRAQEHKAAQLKAEADAHKYEFQSSVYQENTLDTSRAEVQDLKNKNTQLTTEVEDNKSITITDRVANNFMQDFTDDGKFTNYDQFNEFLQANPAMMSLSGGPLAMYNPNNPKHVEGLKGISTKSAKLRGADPEVIFKTFEDMAINGLMGVNANNEVKDLKGLLTVTGAPNRLPNSVNSNFNATVENRAKEVTTNHYRELGLNEVPEWQRDTKSGGKQLWKGKDPEQFAYALQISGMPVSSELKAMIKSNSDLTNEPGSFWDGSTPEQLHEGMKNQSEAILAGDFGSDDEAEKTLARYESGIDNLNDADERKQARKILKSGQDLIKVNNIFNKDDLQMGDENKLISIEDANDDTSAIQKEVTSFNAKDALVTGINDVQDDIIKGVEGDGFVKGVASSPMLMKALGIAPDTAKKVIGMFSDDKVSKDQILNTVGLNSKIGKLVAAYVKETSGGAVTNEERDFLISVLTGALGGDPEVMVKSLSTFRDVVVDEMQKKLDHKLLRSKMPYTMYGSKDISNQVDYNNRLGDVKQSQSEGVTPTPTQANGQLTAKQNLANSIEF